MGGLLGGRDKGYVGPPFQIIGGPPPPHPPSSYSYAYELSSKLRINFNILAKQCLLNLSVMECIDRLITNRACTTIQNKGLCGLFVRKLWLLNIRSLTAVASSFSWHTSEEATFYLMNVKWFSQGALVLTHFSLMIGLV